MEQIAQSSFQPVKPQCEAMIRFVEDISGPDYLQAIVDKVRPYEVEGWKACLYGQFSPFKMKAEGKYLITFLRKIEL